MRTATYPGYLVLAFGIPFAFLAIYCILVCCGVFSWVTLSSIVSCCRRARIRREDRRQDLRERRAEEQLTKEHAKRLKLDRDHERELEWHRRRERQEVEKGQRRILKYQNAAPNMPEAAHRFSPSSVNFYNGSRRIHGFSVASAGSDSRIGRAVEPGPKENLSRTAGWLSNVKAVSKPASAYPSSTRSSSCHETHNRAMSMRTPSNDNISMHSASIMDQRSRLQKKRSRGYSAKTFSPGSVGRISPSSRQSRDLLIGSYGSSSYLYDGPSSIDQQSVSALGPLGRYYG